MSASHLILDYLPSLCQKLSDLAEVSRSYNKNNFACFLRHGVLIELFARLLKASEFHYFNCTVL